jgi:hypothetical protein
VKSDLSPKETANDSLHSLAGALESLRRRLRKDLRNFPADQLSPEQRKCFLDSVHALGAELEEILLKWGPMESGEIDISLGRPDNLAKFFAFNFAHQARVKLATLEGNRFPGSGVYALYYIEGDEPAYSPLLASETPIFVGKATPAHPFASRLREQGPSIYKRLREHCRSISRTELKMEQFEYRAITVQSGMESAVEDFLIRLFKPIWNKEVKVCFGLGKHGDLASTRRNRRSPWDTLHPGRRWAAETNADQKTAEEIRRRIFEHFQKHPPIPSRRELMELISLVTPERLPPPAS